ncbi:hypothetical protein [Runella slithyformis]|uniref:Uncharacterized protein n=1 Tax=Runella slithyformis (strain ATCC 29530 / DSM 19594 / LMG 11500 / NCIMB 11436 / LSU 4) TaxID=761193 RepID=A0A7U3ZJX3_RUNSL|nr:hypothetical protein [Runella slithyformis]AEI48560.1 hypothetical protein Runsl_2147 [Runella slithyformis DSM 19594]
MEPFWNKTLTRDALLTIFIGTVLALSCFYGPTVHLPFLIGVLSGIGVGVLQPRKGWILAIELTMLVVGLYFLISDLRLISPFDADATRFTAFLQFIPIFAGSYLGAYIKRAF